VLDAILELYIEDDLGVEAIVAEGFDERTVRWVVKHVDLNEYKRRQAAPASRSRPAPSAATGACRSRISFTDD